MYSKILWFLLCITVLGVNNTWGSNVWGSNVWGGMTPTTTFGDQDELLQSGIGTTQPSRRQVVDTNRKAADLAEAHAEISRILAPLQAQRDIEAEYFRNIIRPIPIYPNWGQSIEPAPVIIQQPAVVQYHHTAPEPITVQYQPVPYGTVYFTQYYPPGFIAN